MASTLIVGKKVVSVFLRFLFVRDVFVCYEINPGNDSTMILIHGDDLLLMHACVCFVPRPISFYSSSYHIRRSFRHVGSFDVLHFKLQ